MNILLANRVQNNEGGQETIAQSLANGFINKGHRVSILTTKSHKPFNRLVKGIEKTELDFINFVDDYLFKKGSKERILRAAKGKDIVLINNPLKIFAGLVLWTLKRSKTIYCVFHGKGYSKNIFKRILSNLRVFTLINLASFYSEGFIFLTEEDKKFFMRKVFINRQIKKEVIPNGVDTVFLNPSKRNKEKFVVLFIGKMHTSKGVRDILAAAKKLKDKKIHFNFAGPKSNLGKDINQSQNSTYLGVLSREEIKIALDEASLFILPSYSESFPLTILEAMSMELPVISTDIFGVRSILDGTKNSIIQTNDIDGIADAILKFYNNLELTSQVGKENRKTVKEYYSIPSVVDKYLRLFNEG